MSPKSGKAGTPCAPAEAQKPEEADKADPGEVEKIKAKQRQAQSGKYGAVQVPPFKAPETKEEKEKKKAWVEIEMQDEDGKPVSSLPYRITLPDDSVAEGTLNDKGFARVQGFEPGSCKVTFPTLDQELWDKK